MKHFFGKIGAWWQRHRPTRRRIIQLYAALLTNANLKGFFTGRIYTGPVKYACVPGLNCYSCPGAAGACPLGALQNALAQSGTRTPYYIFGILILFGLLLGRTICGFLCPMGLGQELLYKIRTPKLKKSRYTRVLSYLKYAVLAVFVVAIPLLYAFGEKMFPVPAFCKYICPAGTFGGAIGLLVNPANEGLFASLGPLFTWKFVLLCAMCVLCVFVFRAFCRFFCPLGALYGFFNRIALLGVKVDKDACTNCGLCISHCKMDVKRVGDHECIDCGECISVCPAKAISWKGSKLFVHKNETVLLAEPAEETRPLGALLQAAPMESAAAANAEGGSGSFVPAFETASEQKPQPEKRRRGREFWLRFAAWGAAIAVLVGALVYYNFLIPDPPPVGTEVGDSCPSFTLPVYLQGEGRTYSVSGQRGKVVVLNFWTTFCGPCVEEIPYFGQLASEYGNLISVAIVHGTEVIEDVEAFILKQEWQEFPVSFLQDSSEQLMYQTLGGTGTWPMTVLLDGEGVIRYHHPNKINYELIRSEIESLLNE